MSRQRLPFDGGTARTPTRPQQRWAGAPTARFQRRPPPRAVVVRQDTSLVIKFSEYHKPYIDAVKTMHGHRYDADTGTWSVHIGHIRQLRAIAARWPVAWILSPQVRNLPDLDINDLPMVVSAEGEQLVVDGPYRADVWKIMTEADGRLQSATGKWFVPIEHCVDVVLDLRTICNVRFVGTTTELIERIEHATKMLALSRSLKPSDGWELTPKFQRELRDFQHPGVEYLWSARRSFCWATMGAGKTTVALAAIEHQAFTDDRSPYPLLIVPPAGIKTNWVREIQACVPHRSVFVCNGKSVMVPLQTPDIWVANYDVLGQTHNKTGVKLPSWINFFLAQIEAGHIESYIVDEGHRVNNPKSQRTVAVLEAAKGLRPEATRFLLTGTPVRNGKRAELVPQLGAIGRDGEFGDAKQLKKDRRLARRLRTVCAWRPDPTEVLRALGVLKADGTADPIWTPVLVDGDPKVLAEYAKAEADFLAFIVERAREKAVELGEDPDSAAVAAALKVSPALQMLLTNTLCRLAGQAKIPAAREWVADFESSGQKLLVFAENLDMMDAIAGDERPQIRGSVNANKRLALCDRFQEEAGIDPADYVQTLVLQIVAAGEGLTLTKAYDVLFAQLSWVPGAMDQAAARAAWRMNDPHNVFAHLLICAGTIDEIRLEVLAEKRIEMNLVTDGDRLSEISGTSTQSEVLARYIAKALGIKPTP